MTYFNDNEPYAADWLRNLYPYAHVDQRSVTEVSAEDIHGHDQAHFFAGVGGWQYALELAGWRAPAWTASLPCQPFSGAGKGRGTADERHLWPIFRNLVEECQPPVIFGEQVASPLGRQWLTGVRADLEALGYAVGAADLCAASVSAPHIRQRLYWVAYSPSPRLERATGESLQGRGERLAGSSSDGRVAYSEHAGYDRSGAAAAFPGSDQQDRRLHSGGAGGLADTEHNGRRADEPEREPEGRASDGRDSQGPRGLGDADDPRSQGRLFRRDGTYQCFTLPTGMGPWGDFDAIECSDGKVRRFEPGSFPLAHGIPARASKLRAYGNAIVPQVAAEFVAAFMEASGAPT